MIYQPSYIHDINETIKKILAIFIDATIIAQQVVTFRKSNIMIFNIIHKIVVDLNCPRTISQFFGDFFLEQK